MKELLRERDMVRINYYRAILEGNGIQTYVKNEMIAAVEGYSIPAYLPILCVMDDSRATEAMTLINEDVARSQTVSTAELPCPFCKEMVPENFTSCWSCGRDFGELKATKTADGDVGDNADR